jgi:hypothetical protein
MKTPQFIINLANRLNAVKLFRSIEEANSNRPAGCTTFLNWQDVIDCIKSQKPGDPWYQYQLLFG